MKEYAYKIDLMSNTAPARMLRIVGQNKRVLEIGCASGNQTRIMRDELGCNVTAIEFNAEVAESARPFCERLITGSIEKLDLAGLLGEARFDVITFGDVLEHLRNPSAALEKVKPFLAENGYIAASVPNFVHASIIYEMCHGRFDYRSTGLLDDTHIHFFTKRSVAQTFEDAGFFVAKLERAEMRPEHTEFKTRPAYKEQQELLNYIYRNNPECLTYQFVLKAIPITAANSNLTSSIAYAASERISELESVVADREKRINQLESDLAWINDKLLVRLYQMLPWRSK